MRTNLIRFCLLLFGLLGITLTVFCQSNNNDLIILELNFENTGPLQMSDLFSDIRYIPLETNTNCLIGNMTIPFFENEIFVQSHSGQNIFRFTDQGKFLNKIGNMGRGPGEYQDYSDVKLIGEKVFVVSNFSNNVYCYSLSGDFIEKFHLNIEARPKSIIQLQNNSFMIALSNPCDLGSILLTDNKFNIKKGFIKEMPLDDNPLPFGFRKTSEKIFFYHNYLDTIYDISAGYPTPSILIEYRNSKELNKERAQPILNKPTIYNFTASDQFLKLDIYYPFDRQQYTVLYRTSDGMQVTWTKLINDIDNGTIDRWRGILFDDKIVFSLMPSTIIERLRNMTSLEKADPKNSEFVNMASKISLDSNPVIMICKIKIK